MALKPDPRAVEEILRRLVIAEFRKAGCWQAIHSAYRVAVHV